MSVHKIICGKSEIELKQFDDNSFDSCVTDCPYGLEFMGRDWDKFQDVGHWDGNRGYEPHKDAYGRIQGKCPAKYKTSGNNLNFQQFTYEWATELYRVMKPGAHILVFGGTRTYHRMACGVEDAGFTVTDMVEWLYGSGFPKSLNISKQLDKLAGVKPEVIGENPNARDTCGNINICKKNGSGTITAPTTEEAKQWDGFGNNLKPSHEPILLARKPISERNIAANVLRWGVGGLNIDGCRIGAEEIKTQGGDKFKGDNIYGQYNTCKESIHQGRFPANLILSCDCSEDELIEGTAKWSQGHWAKCKVTGYGEFGNGSYEYNGVGEKDDMKCLIHTNPNCVCRMLDGQSGNLNGEIGRANRKQAGDFNGVTPFAKLGVVTKESIKDSGGSSRFFYQAKASQNERWFYCTICKQAYPMKERDRHIHNAPEETKYKYLEFHPTQKPQKLISYLMRLITPPNGTTIDPFLGSGTAIIAAEREGFNCVGIDSKPEYCKMGYVRGKAELAQQKINGERSTIERIGF